MRNEYVKLVEMLNEEKTFSWVIDQLASRLTEAEETDPEVIKLAKMFAYVYSWSGVGHLISDTAKKEKFGIKNGIPTKDEKYNEFTAHLNEIMTDFSDKDMMNKLVLATSLASEYQDEALKVISKKVNEGEGLEKVPFGELLDKEEQPGVIKKIQQLIFDYYRHSL